MLKPTFFHSGITFLPKHNNIFVQSAELSESGSTCIFEMYHQQNFRSLTIISSLWYPNKIYFSNMVAESLRNCFISFPKIFNLFSKSHIHNIRLIYSATPSKKMSTCTCNIDWSTMILWWRCFLLHFIFQALNGLLLLDFFFFNTTTYRPHTFLVLQCKTNTCSDIMSVLIWENATSNLMKPWFVKRNGFTFSLSEIETSFRWMSTWL